MASRSRTVIGIDPGGMCGVAVLRVVPARKVWLAASEVWHLPTERDRFGQLGKTLRHCFHKLLATVSMWNEAIYFVYEDVRFHGAEGSGAGGSGVQAAHIYGAIIGHLTEMCLTNSIEYAAIVPTSARLSAVGLGSADKPWVRNVLETRYRVSLDVGDGKRGKKNFDASDALCCADAFVRRCKWAGSVPKTGSRRRRV